MVPPGITQLKLKGMTGADNNSSVTATISRCRVIPPSPSQKTMILHDSIFWSSPALSVPADFLPYAVNIAPYPVQYLLSVRTEGLTLAVQGTPQVDSSARTHIAYAGRVETPPDTPPAYAVASTMGGANLTTILSDNRRASVQSTYNVYPSQVPVSPDIQNRFALVPIYVYRPDENWRGWFKDLYVAEIPPQTMLNGETVTAQDGSKYTFFNIPPSGDGYYNNFLAADDTNKWLVIRH